MSNKYKTILIGALIVIFCVGLIFFSAVDYSEIAPILWIGVIFLLVGIVSKDKKDKDNTKTVATKEDKGRAKIIIGSLPFVLMTIYIIHSMIAGIEFFGSKMYGFDAFPLVFMICVGKGSLFVIFGVVLIVYGIKDLKEERE